MWPLHNFPQMFNQPNGFTAPKPNSNFSNFNTAFAQAQPKPGMGIAATTNMPWMPNLPNMGFNPAPNVPARPNQAFLPGPNMGFNPGPNMGFNPGPNMGFDPNAGYTPMLWQDTKPDWYGGDYFTGLVTAKGGSKVDGGVKGGDVKDGGKTGPLSGKGSIDGANFKSGDGERYELKVEAGKSYNLLSDAGIGLNGTYGKDSSGETVLTDIALSVGGKIVTLADDGTLRVDGKAFDKKKNNLEGLVTENKDGTYTVKANGYEFELKASENGIKVKIDAKSARTPEGLWGVALDGEKNTEKELQKAIKESDYKIDDALTFDYEDQNNIGEKYMPDLDDEERSDLAWNARNPKLSAANLLLNNGTFGVQGPLGTVDDAYWSTVLDPKKVYNVFSDESIQVNGKFTAGRAQELGFVVDGDEIKITRDSAGNPKVTVNDTELTAGQSSGAVSIASNGTVTIKSGDSDDENYTFTITKGEGLNMSANIKNVGANETRSSGLLGDAISSNIRNVSGSGDNDGASYLRNVDGSLSKAGDNMTKALREYLVDDLFDTGSGRSVYD